MRIYLIFILLVLLIIHTIHGVEITIHKKDATVWSLQQIINGEVNDTTITNGTLYINGDTIPFFISSIDQKFSVPISIHEGENDVVVSVDSSGVEVFSDTLWLTLGFDLCPEVETWATVSGNSVQLHSRIISNPDSSQLSYSWFADSTNPLPVTITGNNDTLAYTNIPSNAPEGEYYFNLLVSAADGDSVWARTFVTVDSLQIIPFNIRTDHASWIDSAVVYQITPYNFVVNGKFNHVTTKIPELVELGITTIYLQPIYETFYGGQGYDIIDYFKIRPDYGTEDQLRTLISTAKSHGLRVLFDFVANHSSIKHPYAQNSISYGTDSHYWDFYQREFNSAPYSMHYRFYQGFINYFWNELPNLNYDNSEVQRWISEAAKYWIEEFDIDGYRFDAIWGVNAREPEFTKQLRLKLKRIKPEILMLAEDKATWPSTFDERFDVAYDWAPEESWVSHWTWQWDYDPNGNKTIFNHPNQNSRSNLLRNALTNNGNGFHPKAIVLHFMENNDTFRFIQHHGLDRTKMVAAFLMTLSGIPMLYNGQEIGFDQHPYSTNFIFFPSRTIRSRDVHGLFPYYAELIRLRKILPALNGSNFMELPVNPNNYVFAYRRWQGDQNVFAVMNMGASAVNANVILPIDQIDLDSTRTYYLTEMLSGEVISGIPNVLQNISVNLNKYNTKLFLLADSILTVGIQSDLASNFPVKFELHQNYPNPFNPQTTIRYTVAKAGKVKLRIYDILGREVVNLVDGVVNAGIHDIIFDASKLASGIYFYRLESDDGTKSRKMMLIK